MIRKPLFSLFTILFVVLLIIFTQGCATIQNHWQVAQSTNTIRSYEDFLERYPDSEFVDDARKNITTIKEQIKQLDKAVRNVLPSGSEINIRSISRYPDKPEFVIWAHLLEGHSADENNPYVRGNYGTHEKLTRLVRYRCAKILKSISEGKIIPDGSSMKIVSMHGVRQIYNPMLDRNPNPIVVNQRMNAAPVDKAMAIYIITIPIDIMKRSDLSKLSEEKIMSLWDVTTNIIPELQFGSEWFR